MTDFTAYKNNRIQTGKEQLKLAKQKREQLEAKERQLELYEKNTGKIDAKAHLEVATEYRQNRAMMEEAVVAVLGAKAAQEVALQAQKITADMLDC